MAENIEISGESKSEKYESLLPQIHALVGDEKDLTANLANIAAALKQAFDFFWVGFYWVKNDELVLAPFQGPIACTRIQLGRGVCGTAWKSKEVILVPNVDEFPGHIACSSLSKSELVVPIKKGEKVLGILDVDSDQLNDFDEIDTLYLTQLCTWISSLV